MMNRDLMQRNIVRQQVNQVMNWIEYTHPEMPQQQVHKLRKQKTMAASQAVLLTEQYGGIITHRSGRIAWVPPYEYFPPIHR